MRAFVPTLVCASLVLASCTDDLDAPYNYQQGTDSEGVDTGDGLMLDCSALGQAAVGATYSRTITATGGQAPYEFAATPLPAGLTIDATAGTVSGSPTTVGENALTVTVTDATGESVSESCALPVGPQLALDPLALDAVPYCLSGADTLLAHVTEGTGDGTPIVCDTPGGNGNGKLPAGVSIDPDSCAPVGTITDTRLGTWAFVVRGTQSGAEVLMPYCVTNDSPATGTFDIEVTHTGAAGRTLVPLSRTFNPNGSLAVGGQDDPRFEITGDACSDNFCSYGYNFFINASPFDADTLSLAPDDLLSDDADQPIGFFHNLSIAGPVVPDAFKTRPWVVNIDLDYCISADAADCEPSAIPDNANGFLEFSIIMVPQPE